MAQMNLSIEKKIMDLENRLVVAKGEEEGMGGTGRDWELGVNSPECSLWDGLAVGSCGVALGILSLYL